MRNRQTFILAFWFLLSATLLALPCGALSMPESVGTVVAVRGTVEAVSASGKARRLAIKDPIFAEDSIKTKARGRIQMLFIDNTIVSLGQNTDMKIAEYRWSSTAGKEAAMKTKVSEGTFRVLGGAITKAAPKNFTTETPAATIGIRGSSYAGKVTPDHQLSVMLLGGKGIDVFNSAGTTPVTKHGFGTYASPGVPPAQAFKFTAQDLQHLDASLSDNGAPHEQEETGEQPQGDDDQAGANEDDGGDDGQGTAATDGSGDDGGDNSQDTTATDGSGEDGEQAPTDQAAADQEQPPADEGAPPPPGDETAQPPADEAAQPSGGEATQPPADEGAPPPVMTQEDTAAPPPPPADAGGTTMAQTDSPPVDMPTEIMPPPPTNANQPTVSPDTTGLVMNATQGTTQTASETNLVENLSAATGTTITDFNTLTTSTNVQETITVALTDTSINAQLDALAYPATYRYRATVPSNGIEGFEGILKGTHKDLDGTTEVIDGFSELEVNWYNRKFIGVAHDQYHNTNEPDPPVFFFGSVNANGTISSAKIIGSDLRWDEAFQGYYPSIITGSTTNGEFIGPQTDFAVGFNAAGTNIDLQNGTSGGTWNITGAALSQGINAGDETAPTGNRVWEGFVVGLGEDITAPDTNRRLFMNTNSGDFQMNLNQDTGTVGGTIHATDVITTSPVTDVNITIGSGGSAYVLKDNLIALLDGSVTNSGGTNSLKPNFSYLGTGDPSKRIATYVEWGIWEAAYIDPQSLKTYHIHLPASWWVAGEPTLIGDLPTTGSATYTGKVIASHITNNGQNPLEGTTSIQVDFANLMAASGIQGSINIPNELNLNFASVAGNTTTGGLFNITNVNGANVATGKVNGRFFGPAAASIAGNFQAKMVDSSRYLGIFGGDK